jgi:hypothetical protein
VPHPHAQEGWWNGSRLAVAAVPLPHLGTAYGKDQIFEFNTEREPMAKPISIPPGTATTHLLSEEEFEPPWIDDSDIEDGLYDDALREGRYRTATTGR